MVEVLSHSMPRYSAMSQPTACVSLGPHAFARAISPVGFAYRPVRQMALVSAWLIAAGVSLLAVSDAATAQVTPRVDTLKAELLSQPPAIGQPGFIQPWGKHLLVSDWLGDPNLHVLDRATGELIVSFGRIGRGPGEFPNVLAGVQRPSHDTTAIWVYDARKMTRIEGPGGMGPDVTAIDLTAIPLVLRAAWMDSTTILGVTWEPPERRFVFFDGAGSVIRATSGVLLGHDGIPLSQRLEASAQFAFCMRPDGSRFALLYKRAARVQIYDRSARHLTDADVPYSIDATFRQADGEIRFVQEWITYQACWAGGDVLYALYSGDDYGTASGETLGGEEIHVFDWDSGRLMRRLYLDTRVFGVAVDEDSGWLYGGSLQDAGIYRFRFSSGGSEW